MLWVIWEGRGGELDSQEAMSPLHAARVLADMIEEAGGEIAEGDTFRVVSRES